MINSYFCKNDNFKMKSCDSFLLSDQNKDFGYSLKAPHQREGSNEYTQLMFLRRNKKKNKMYTLQLTCKLQTRLTICSLRILTICNLSFPFWF